MVDKLVYDEKCSPLFNVSNLGQYINEIIFIAFNKEFYCWLRTEMGIYRDNLSAIVIGDNFLPIIGIAQNTVVWIYLLPISFL